MSLPIVIIFERHWDTIPKHAVKELLPDLNKRGYETFCFEASQDLSFAEIVGRHKAGLAFDSDIQQQAEEYLKPIGITRALSDISFSHLTDLLQLFVSSKQYLTVAERIKQLPASRMLKEVFDEATRLSITVKGIDIDSKDYDKIISADVSTRMSETGRSDKNFYVDF